VLRSLGCDRIKQSGAKVISTCPLAPWRHSGGRDKQPSFAVFVKDADASGANCYGVRCNFHGSLRDLVSKFEILSRNKLPDLHFFISSNNQSDLDKAFKKVDAQGGMYSTPSKSASSDLVWTEGKDYSDPAVLAKAYPALPEEDEVRVQEMVDLLNEDVLEYLRGPERRLTDETIKSWRLGWHPGASRISIPQYDHIGRLVNIAGRLLDLHPQCLPGGWEDRRPKWMHGKGFKREFYLFGEDRFSVSDDGRGTVFLAEGAFDVIYLCQSGIPNVGAINGSYVNKAQVDKILRWFDRVVLVMDGDQAGVDASKRLFDRLSQQIHVDTYLVPDGRDPNEMTDDEINDLKVRFLG